MRLEHSFDYSKLCALPECNQQATKAIVAAVVVVDLDAVSSIIAANSSKEVTSC